MVIYKITNRLNGKPYIGQTRQPLEKRFLQHAAAKTPLGDAMRKCGLENFTIEVVEECATPELTKARERFWIKVLKCKVPNGYNQSDGGESCSPKATERKYIGKYLRRFREAFKLKQNKVAAAVGLAPQMYIKYEKDQMSPSVTLVINLANEFNVSADYLLGLSDEPRPVKHDNEQEIKAAFEFRDRWQSLLQAASAQGLLPQPAATA